jgi:rhodanese-related sulfurtransferase
MVNAMNKRIFLWTVCLLSAVTAWSADEKGSAVKRIGIEEYERLRRDTNNVVLDVRSKAEFEKGHIAGATNIDINSLRFDEVVAKLDTNRTYLVNCAVGMRSARACKKMEGVGFKSLYDLAPGFEGWKKAGKPIEK